MDRILRIVFSRVKILALPVNRRSVSRYLLLLTAHGSLLISIVLLTAHCLLLTVSAQVLEPADKITIDSDLVNLNVSVFNRNLGQSNPTLHQNDFIIYENGVRQDISFFAPAEAPFDLVLLLDLSGSTADKLGLVKKSAKRFVEAARSNDRIAVVTFTADVAVVSSLTSDHETLNGSIDAIKKTGGGTNFWDALRFVLEHLLGQTRAERRRGAVIVMTDGVDNALPGVFGDGSSTSFEELIGIVRRADTIILPIYLDTEKDSNSHNMPHSAYVMAQEQLAMLAAESGNQVYQARKLKDLDGVYVQVIRDLSTIYSIGYRPRNLDRDGSWRNVSVQLIGHSDLAVRTRQGYYASRP